MIPLLTGSTGLEVLTGISWDAQDVRKHQYINGG